MSSADPDVLIVEMTWTGTMHAPGNAATIGTVKAAFPSGPLHVFADPTHLVELQRDEALAVEGHVHWHAIRPSGLYRGRTGIVSFRRIAREGAILLAAFRHVRRGRPCLLFLLSATPTAIFAAACLARFRPNCAVQIGLHGNLNDIRSARPRNPFRRALDLPAALRLGDGGRLRFLVLDECIVATLASLCPKAATRTDVLKLPVNSGENPRPPGTLPSTEALHVGFVGQATTAKGIEVFLRLAHSLTEQFPGRIVFHLIGRAMPGADLAAFAPLAEQVGTAHLSRAEFVERLARLHYVVLPFQPGYYDLAASGALLDALTWLKPIIAMRGAMAESFFVEGGEIGHLCNTEGDLHATLVALLESPDPGRYARQIDALSVMRHARRADQLAPTYRAMMLRNFPFLAGTR